MWTTRLTLALALGLGTATAALATPSEPTQTQSYTSSVSFGRLDTDFLFAIALPQINPAHFAALTSITVTLGGSVYGDYIAVNTSKTSAVSAGTAELKATLTLFGPDPTLTSSTLPSDYVLPVLPTLGVTIPVLDRMITAGSPLAKEPFTFNRSLFNINDPSTYNAGSATSATNLSASSTSTTTTTSLDPNFSTLATEFMGYGQIYVPVQALANSTFIGSGNVASQFNTDASADILVTVTYTTVPEPATAGLLAIGALLCTAAARRRRPRAEPTAESLT